MEKFNWNSAGMTDDGPWRSTCSKSSSPEGGLLPNQLAVCVGEITSRFAVAAAAVASYDPDHDREDRVLSAALDVLELVASSRHPGVRGSPRETCFRVHSMG